MSGLAVNVIFGSAEGFYFDRPSVFGRKSEKSLCCAVWSKQKSAQKSSILAKSEQQAERLGWVRFVLPSSSAQGANEHFLMNLQVWEKTVAIIFCIFSPVSMCDRTMVPSTTLESFKSGAFVVPGSTGSDLQTHTKTTMSRCFGCLVEMDENCHLANMCTHENQ